MLLTDEEINNRVSSSNNLLNRLGLGTVKQISVPSLPEKSSNQIIDIPAVPGSNNTARAKTELTIDELIDDVETKVQIGNAQLKAINVLNNAISKINLDLDSFEPKELVATASRMHKIIHDNRRKYLGDEQGHIPQVIIYKPMMINLDQMNVVEISE